MNDQLARFQDCLAEEPVSAVFKQWLAEERLPLPVQHRYEVTMDFGGFTWDRREVQASTVQGAIEEAFFYIDEDTRLHAAEVTVTVRMR